RSEEPGAAEQPPTSEFEGALPPTQTSCPWWPTPHWRDWQSSSREQGSPSAASADGVPGGSPPFDADGGSPPPVPGLLGAPGPAISGDGAGPAMSGGESGCCGSFAWMYGSTNDTIASSRVS